MVVDMRDVLVGIGYVLSGVGLGAWGVMKKMGGPDRPSKPKLWNGVDRRAVDIGTTLTIGEETVKQVVTAFQNHVQTQADIVAEMRNHTSAIDKLVTLMEKSLTGITLANQALGQLLNPKRGKDEPHLRGV